MKPLLIVALCIALAESRCGFVGCRYFKNLYQIYCPNGIDRLIAEADSCGVNTLKLHNTFPLADHRQVVKNATSHEEYLKEIITWTTLFCLCSDNWIRCKAQDCT